MILKLITLNLCAWFHVSNSAIVDKVIKCRSQDEACLKEILQTLLMGLSEDHITDLDLPGIDPYHAKDLEINIPDLLEIKLIDAEIKGAKDCVVNKFELQIKQDRAFLDISCAKFTIRGEYKLSSFSSTIKQIFGSNSIHGQGNTDVKFENINVRMTYAYELQERDGEIYFNTAGRIPDLDNIHIAYVHFDADSIYLGKENARKQIVDFVNSNWKQFETTVGAIFGAKLVDIVADYVTKILDTFPANTFLDDDLAAYAKH